MTIRYAKSFAKNYQNLQPAQRKRLKQSIALFQDKPNHPLLYNHSLTGQWRGHRSISFGGDWRAVYYMDEDEAVFVACGTHGQLYK